MEAKNNSAPKHASGKNEWIGPIGGLTVPVHCLPSSVDLGPAAFYFPELLSDDFADLPMSFEGHSNSFF